MSYKLEGGFAKARIGMVAEGMKLIMKNQVSLDECPICKGKKTFHSECMKKNIPNNVLHGESNHGEDGTYNYCKYDICFSCGYRWIFESYLWRKK